ncbi:MAG: DNA gyrase inhibitor YacG [Pyrinomonadaceae bacterium]|nr:DNA gyrase inhibitor YacG [Pyrinomonadaceae bacterium]
MNCPNCDKPVTWQDNPNRPFCSERCKLIDFGKWADEEYRVSTQIRPEEESGTEFESHASSDDAGGSR